MDHTDTDATGREHSDRADVNRSNRAMGEGPMSRWTAAQIPLRWKGRPVGSRSVIRKTTLARTTAGAAMVALLGLMAPTVAAASTADRFTQSNLVADNASFGAKLVDPNLTNAWGLAGPGPLWVADNNSGNVGIYSGGVGGSPVVLDFTVPVPGGNPTGQVYNSTSSFHVGGATGSPATFIVDSDSVGATQSPGEIAAWNGGPTFVVEDSSTGGPGGKVPSHAVFKGLALSPTSAHGARLYAADVRERQGGRLQRLVRSGRSEHRVHRPDDPCWLCPLRHPTPRGEGLRLLRQAERSQDERGPRQGTRLRRCLQCERQAAAPPHLRGCLQPSQRAVGHGRRTCGIRSVRQ